MKYLDSLYNLVIWCLQMFFFVFLFFWKDKNLTWKKLAVLSESHFNLIVYFSGYSK